MDGVWTEAEEVCTDPTEPCETNTFDGDRSEYLGADQIGYTSTVIESTCSDESGYSATLLSLSTNWTDSEGVTHMEELIQGWLALLECEPARARSS